MEKFIKLAKKENAIVFIDEFHAIMGLGQGEHSNIGTVFFAVGFTLMMVLDVALG